MIDRTGGDGSLGLMGGGGAGPVVDDLVALVRRRPAVGATRLVTLDGHSGAGKTRLAGRLARALDRAPVVHLDFFYPGWDGLAAGVDLALHHPDWAGKLLGGGIRIRGLQDRHAARNRHAEFMQQSLGLVFMDIHLDAPQNP